MNWLVRLSFKFNVIHTEVINTNFDNGKGFSRPLAWKRMYLTPSVLSVFADLSVGSPLILLIILNVNKLVL